MIRSVKGSATRRFAESGKARFSDLDETLARRRLAAVDAATSLESLGRLKSAGLHKLARERVGFWAVSVNGPWRIVFRFEDGDAWDVEIADYHKG